MENTEMREGYKFCSRCLDSVGEYRPVSEFYANASSNDGLSSWCKVCQKEYNKSYQKRVRVKARRKKYYQERKMIEAKTKQYPAKIPNKINLGSVIQKFLVAEIDAAVAKKLSKIL